MSSAGIKNQIAILVPGYYGSTLIDHTTGREIWGDAREIFFGRKTLALPIPGVPIPGALNLRANSVIPDKKILGGLLKEDSYDKTIALLKTIGCIEIFLVAWDWRKDPIEGIRKIDQTVKLAHAKYPDHEIIFISHSFGSLISSYYLRYGAQDFFDAKETWEGMKYFSKIILSAAPFKGLMSIFRNMHHGIRFGFNHNMQTPMAFCTFESSYYLLPPAGLDTVFDEELNLQSLNLYNPMNWIENRWGLFHEQLNLPKESIGARKNFLSLHLGRSLKWQELIHAPLALKPDNIVPILYLTGKGMKTSNNGVWLKNHHDPNIFLYYSKNFKKWKSKINPDVVFCDGDQTVPDFSLELPEAFKELNTSIVEDERGHLDILQHLSSQVKISHFIKSSKFF